MPKLVGTKVTGSVSYVDLFGAGLVKMFSDGLLGGVVGDDTIKSGAIKLVGGLVSRKFLGRGILGDSLSLGLSVGGVEDIINSLIKPVGTGANNTDW